MRFLILAFVFLLTACGTTPTTTGKYDMQERAGALLRVTQDPTFVIQVVPSAGNFISNQLTVAMLKAGTETTSSEQIVQMLSAKSAVKLAITSKDDAIAAATLERALASLKEKPTAPHQIAFIGSKDFQEELVTKAAQAGIQLLYVPYP